MPPDFNWRLYLLTNKDLMDAGLRTAKEAWNHFEEHGRREGRAYPLVPSRVPEGEAIYQRIQNFSGEHYEIIRNHVVSSTEISVIVTLYNYQDHIQKCIESVRKNKFPDVEIVVVNDASTDESLDRVLPFLKEECKISLINKKVNTGCAHSRNLGIDLCAGNYVFILDADNCIYENCLSTHYQFLKETDLFACYGIVECFDETGNFMGCFSDRSFDYRVLQEANYIDAMAMFHKKRLQDIGKYDLELIQYGIGYEDYELWLKAGKNQQKVGFINQPLSRYLVKEESMIQITNKKYIKNLQSYLLEKILF